MRMKEGEITQTEKDILTTIKEHGPLNVYQLVKKINKGTTTIKLRCQEMCLEGKIYDKRKIVNNRVSIKYDIKK